MKLVKNCQYQLKAYVGQKMELEGTLVVAGGCFLAPNMDAFFSDDKIPTADEDSALEKILLKAPIPVSGGGPVVLDTEARVACTIVCSDGDTLSINQITGLKVFYNGQTFHLIETSD